MFDSMVIRKLARSEEMFAETHNFVGLGAHLKGPVDVDALSAAFDALLEAHPVLAGHLDRGPDGRHQIVVDDLVHPGTEVVKLDGAAAEPPIHLDQSESLAQLRLTIRDGQAQPTLYIHHSLADGHHQFSLVEELFSYYTDLVCTGRIPSVTVHPAPEPLEVALAQRRIDKLQRSGLERFMPAMFAYDLPPSRRATTNAKPALPLHVPVARCRLTEEHTRALIAFCRAHRLRSNAVLSAAILLAEWRLRDTPNIPVPYIYPVDLRYILSPPLSATACTNPLGVATYLAEIDHNTDVVELARDIAETFQADVSDGVVQQSLLHFSPQYVGNAPGLPDVVMLTDAGPVPTVRTPPDLEVIGCQSDMYFAVDAGIDIYFSGIFADQMWIERHSHAPAPEKSIEAIRSLLCTIAEQHGATSVI
jgi:phenolphthiocerol/phthiocerol/phthiodiolone dimycocerosyl transferase